MIVRPIAQISLSSLRSGGDPSCFCRRSAGLAIRRTPRSRLGVSAGPTWASFKKHLDKSLATGGRSSASRFLADS